MLTGAPLILVFLLSVAILLITIIKFRMNAFLSLLLTAIVTAFIVGMPVQDIGSSVSNGFGSTLAGIGIVTGLGVMLGKFMFESGGIQNLADMLLKKLGEKNSPVAVGLSGFFTGIPVFGDVVYIMFAPMLRVLSKKTKISMTCYACAISVATTCTFALVLPTAPPLAVATELDLNIGVFFFYALISAFVGMFCGGLLYGIYLKKRDEKTGHNLSFDFSDLDETEVLNEEKSKGKTLSVGKTVSILLVPITLILIGSFGAAFLPGGSEILGVMQFFGDKNIAMLIGVLYAAFITKPYIKKGASAVMTEAADQIGLILLITGAGGAYGQILKATGIADYIAQTLSGYSIPILLLCFLISQIIRCAQGSTTVSLITTASILSSTIASSTVSPILCAIAICAGGIGLSLPNDSGFWAIGRFFKISPQDTLRSWTAGGFVAGVSILVFVFILSFAQDFLPGL